MSTNMGKLKKSYSERQGRDIFQRFTYDHFSFFLLGVGVATLR